jgi:hypothetical protein
LEDIARRPADAAFLLAAFKRLTDEDILDWERLPVPRGDEGSWVCFRMGDALVMAQWDKGNPAIWKFGLGRGFLKVVHLAAPEELAEVIATMLENDE